MKSIVLGLASVWVTMSAFAAEVKDFSQFTKAIEQRGVHAAVRVEQNGKALYEQAFGYADLDAKKLNATDTRFAIGSATKQITAAGILLLKDRGVLTMASTLAELLPEYKFPWADKVNVHQLLTHTSGIPSYTGAKGFFKMVVDKGTALNDDDILATFRDQELEFEPGAKWDYNNSGYFLAGLIIEKYSKLTFGEFIKKEFFTPLEMTSAAYDPYAPFGPDDALPIDIDGDYHESVDRTHPVMKWAGPAGGVMVTVGDFAKWMQWLHHGQTLLSSDSKALLTTSQVDDGHGGRYGYGLGFGDMAGEDAVYHGGDMPGFHFRDIYLTKQDISVVVATNQEPPDVRSLISAALLQLLVKGTVSIDEFREDVAVSDAVLKNHEGTYKVLEEPGKGLEATVSLNPAGKLYIQLKGQPQLWLVPQGERVFAIKNIAKVTFAEDGKSFVLRQMGTDLTFQRHSD